LPRLVKALIAAKIAKTKNMNELSPKGCAFKGGRFGTILIFLLRNKKYKAKIVPVIYEAMAKPMARELAKAVVLPVLWPSFQKLTGY
jgi:hypothetical protein